MPMLFDNVLDASLAVIVAGGSRLDICSTEPASYAGIAAVTLGNKTALSVGAPADKAGGGRKVTVASFANGSCTGTGTAAYFAISNGAAIIYATGALSAPVAVANGATFSLTAFDIAIPDPA